MSADNWTTCPRCLAKAEVAKAKQRDNAAKAYGKLKPDEWIALQAEASNPVELNSSLREDYELGVLTDGEFYVNYRASCTNAGCGFAFEYKHQQQVEI